MNLTSLFLAPVEYDPITKLAVPDKERDIYSELGLLNSFEYDCFKNPRSEIIILRMKEYSAVVAVTSARQFLYTDKHLVKYGFELMEHGAYLHGYSKNEIKFWLWVNPQYTPKVEK